MREQIRLSGIQILVVSGFISFFFHIKKLTPLLLGAVLYAIAILVRDRNFHRRGWEILFPFASGLLGFLCRFFYWDNFDWAKRMGILLLFSVLFSILILFQQLRLMKKFLLFFNRLRSGKRLISIFVFSEIVFICAAGIHTLKKVGPVGDEPHYLVIAQSLARDLDLNVFNQYARDQYREFIDQHLQPHARAGKGFKKWYSFHLPGLAFTIAPFFVFRISPPLLYFLIRSYLGIFSSLLSLLVYLLSLKIWKSRSLALWITAVFCFTSPIFFLSIHAFAEIQALLLVLSSIYFLFFREKQSGLNAIFAGLLLGMMVFWGMKYIIFIYPMALGCFGYFLWKKEKKKAFLFIIFPLLFQLLFFSFLWSAYGSFSPMSIYTGVMTEDQAITYYGNIKKISLQSRINTLLDYFFDQRDGILPYNLFYFFFFPGLILAFKKIRTYSPYLLFSLSSFLYLLYHGFSTVRAGVCPQGRYLVPVMWTLMIFCIIYYRENRNRFFRKIFLGLPLYSLSVVAYQIFHPFTLYQPTTHDYLFRPGLMFQQWSNIHIDISGMLSSFIKNVPTPVAPFYRPSQNWGYVPNIIMLSIFLLMIVLALLPKLGIKMKLCWFCIYSGLFFLFVLFPRPRLFNPIMIQKAGTAPHLIHGVSFQPKKMTQKKFPLEKGGTLSILISTRQEISLWEVEVQNTGSASTCARIQNFDREIQRMPISPSGITRIVMKNPRSKKFHNRFYYQFFIQGEKKFFPQGHLLFELYPLKKPRFSAGSL